MSGSNELLQYFIFFVHPLIDPYRTTQSQNVLVLAALAQAISQITKFSAHIYLPNNFTTYYPPY